MTATTSGDRNRIHAVDALRGFALLGVGLVHMLEQYAAAAPIEVVSKVAYAGIIDQIIAGLNQVFMVGKFYLIFSLLFGLSFFIQLERPVREGRAFSGRFVWRLALLFGFGFVHHLFHRGDILMLYAILGLSLLLLQRLDTRVLLVMAVALFLGFGRYLSFLLLGDSLSLVPGDSPENAAYFAVLMQGSLAEVIAQNLEHGTRILVAFQFGMTGRGYVTLGLFMVGLVLGRSGFFKDLSAHRSSILRALRWAGASSVVFLFMTGGLFSQVKSPGSFSTWMEALGLTSYDLFNLSLATVLSCTFLLAFQSTRWNRLTGLFAPFGRMALTNYLLQSLIGTALYYGWGLGQLGEWPMRWLLLFGLTIAAFQVIASRVWLTHFRYGPCEWLWRSLTLRQSIPMRRLAVDAP